MSSNRRDNRDRTGGTDRPNNRRRRSAQGNVVKYRPPININPGLIIIGVLFVYIIVVIASYFKTDHITPYEVKKGSLAVNNTYTAIALREEIPVLTEYNGYINYYSREAERVSKNSMIYTIDSTGKLSDMMNSDAGENASKLSAEDMTELKTQVSTFASSFTPKEYYRTYDFKYDIEGTVLKLANYNVLSNLDSISSAGFADSVNFGYSPEAGVLVYSIDGFEETTAEEITKASFDEEAYSRTQFHSNQLVSAGDSVYKLLTNEDWSIVMEIDEERCMELEQESYIEVRFLKNNYTSWGKITILRQDGTIFLKLDFNNSLITFATDRFLEVELLSDSKEGLKIPNSSIVDKPFFIIPIEYLTYGENGSETGFIRETYLDDGSVSSEFVAAPIYNSNDEYYFVDERDFNIGDYIIPPNQGTDATDIAADKKYPISRQLPLTGVYNINKGYADFKQVTVLAQNDEYSIVESNSQYGLSVYDYIVLDGSTVKDDDFIYD